MASPNKKKLTAVCSLKLAEQIENFRNKREISTSEALSRLAEKGLEAVSTKNGGFLSAEAVALAEIFDKLDNQGQNFLKMAADLMLERAQPLERTSAVISLVARNNPGGPIQKEAVVPFLVGQAQESDEDL